MYKRQALYILQKQYKETCNGEVKDFASTAYDGPNYTAYESYFTELKNQGLVTLKVKNYKKGKSTASITHTKLAIQKYNLGTGFNSFKIDLLKFIPKQISGISYSDEGNRAVILFTGDYVPTPFYKIKAKKTRCHKSKNIERKATFVRYDTGWRLE